MQSITAQKLWAGWQEKDVYIIYNERTGTVLYAKDAHSPQCNSLDVLKEILKDK